MNTKGNKCQIMVDVCVPFDDFRIGVTNRNEIGLLIFEKNELVTAELNVGSMLKTPTLPMWVTISNGIAGVIFNPNQELVRSHRSETRYIL